MSNILTTITSEAPKTTLWYYTNQKGSLGIISNKAIWANHHQYLNDRAEFTHAQNLLYEEIAMRLAISGLSNDDSQEDCLEKLKTHSTLP